MGLSGRLKILFDVEDAETLLLLADEGSDSCEVRLKFREEQKSRLPPSSRSHHQAQLEKATSRPLITVASETEAEAGVQLTDGDR